MRILVLDHRHPPSNTASPRGRVIEQAMRQAQPYEPNDTIGDGTSCIADRILDALNRHSGVGVVVMDLSGVVLHWNGAIERMLGYASAETVGRRMPWAPPSERAEFARALRDVAAGVPWVGRMIRRARKDGSLADLRVSAYPLPRPDGVVDAVIGLLEDVTDSERYRALHKRLTEVTSAVSGFASLDGILRMVRDAVVEFGGFDRAGVFQVVGTEVHGAWGTAPDGSPRPEAGLRETLDDWGLSIGDIARGTKPFVIEAWLPGDMEPTPAKPVMHVVMGMRAGDELVGLISADNLLSGRPVLESDVLPLIPFAEEAAVAIRAVRLHDRVRTYADDLEREVAERTSELERVVADLEQFAYRVAHDLRAPLRAVDSIAHIIAEDMRGDTPTQEPEMRERLGRISGSARHAGRLVDDLLTLARVGRRPFEPSATDPAEAARDAWRMLAEVHQGRSVQIVIHDMPAVIADRGMLVEVYARALDNALKFTRKREQATVEVGSRPSGTAGAVELFVRDNGVGLDEADADRIFGVFARLHGPDEYEGSGIGLAIVKRILERHGGRVGASGSEGSGATVFWELRAAG